MKNERSKKMSYKQMLKQIVRPFGRFPLVRNVKKAWRLLPNTKLRFEVHLTEHCNLNCKGCDNYSPLAEKEFLDIEEFKRDCGRLSELFKGKIEELSLLGGEPLLHPQIADFLEISRKNFPIGEIRIITNGLLLPKMNEKFWENCRKYDIVISPTRYPINFDYEGVEEMAYSGG